MKSASIIYLLHCALHLWMNLNVVLQPAPLNCRIVLMPQAYSTKNGDKMRNFNVSIFIIGHPSLSIKGTVSRDRYFCWRSKHFNQYFLSMRWWFSRSFKGFSLPIKLVRRNFSFTSFKLLTNLKRLTVLRISFTVIGRCSQVQGPAAVKMRKN